MYDPRGEAMESEQKRTKTKRVRRFFDTQLKKKPSLSLIALTPRDGTGVSVG